MTSKSLLALFISLLLIAGPMFLFRPLSINENEPLSFFLTHSTRENEPEDQHEKETFSEKRMLHEWRMLRNPVTGTIPANIHEIETRVLNNIPAKHDGININGTPVSSAFRTLNQNTYTSIGPTNIAGRGRALAFDRRNANIILTGGVTGGIFRSTDGGATWTFVSGENDIRSATTLAQDPRNPDVWYCGTGEVWYSFSTSISFTVGYGIFKSTNNGASWTKLPATVPGQEHAFDSEFDLVYRIAVHPTTSHVYAAVHGRVMRSTDGGTTWTNVIGSSIDRTAAGGITELLVSSNGSRIFAAFTGSNSVRTLAGVWESTSGNTGDWRRIAGGPLGQADSVAGWQPYGQWSRVVLGINNSNTQLFALYKNGKSAEGSNPQPEADLFRATIPSGNSTFTWTNLSSYVPDEPNFNFVGIDPYTTQFLGFNMSITPKPDNDNILFIGGVNLHRVDLTRTDPAQKFRRIGGYGQGFFPSGNFIYPNHHPDVHKIVFPPGATDLLYTVSDGGVHRTATSTMADTVRWLPRNTNLQTLQFQKITIHPDTEANFVTGGTQDNGTVTTTNPTSQTYLQLSGGDGASSSVSKFSKNGNIWTQYLYSSAPLGTIFRSTLQWTVSGNNLSGEFTARDVRITPSGQAENGQFVTLFIMDPDSSEHIYYSSKNKLFRTRSASTVSSSGWTEITGIGNTIPTSTDMTALSISKARNSVKYLFIGTDGGKVYRVNNANVANASTIPEDITPPTMTANSFVADISVNPRNPDTVMAVVANYDAANAPVSNIFWTGNATSATPTWQVLDGALGPVSSQSCAIVVKTTGVEYYVGTSIGLYSTTAVNGNTIQWFNEGSGMLKRAIVRSLYNRQQDNTLVVGTHGNGAFLAAIGSAVPLENNVVTSINAPITNDRNFIRAVFPTLTRGEIFFTTGNLLTVRNITVQLFGMNGQMVYQALQGYQNGSVKKNALPAGQYILQISSADGRYRHVQKILKE